MDTPLLTKLVLELLIVLSAGMVAGMICRRLGVSMVLGYLLAGVLLGATASRLAGEVAQDLHFLARAGALLLLFSIGIEFSLEEMVLLSRSFFIGGFTQMALVAAPVVGLELLLGLSWQAAILVGISVALSSTVLVYKALEEWGQADTAHGRRALGILLFQDVAVVPLFLIVPFLIGSGVTQSGWQHWTGPIARGLAYVAAVLIVRWLIGRCAVPVMAALRSIELLILFALIVLGAATFTAHLIGLPPALGALAAGVALSGNRLSGQIDALILPFRETFAAVFFVSLGTLMRMDVLAIAPATTLAGLVLALVLKTGAAAIALRLVGLPWKAALGMGMGLAQLGELSFVVLSAGAEQKLIPELVYDQVLFIALGTLVLTPQLLKTGLRLVGQRLGPGVDSDRANEISAGPVERAIVVGLGPIGGRVATQLETAGVDVCLVDLSPVNLQSFAQQGFRTIAGDASDRAILQRARIAECRLAAVTVPDDVVAHNIVAAIRAENANCTIVVRCRYQASAAGARRAGANAVVAEETEAAGAILRLLARVEAPATP